MPASNIIQQALKIFKTATRPIVRKGWAHWVRFALLLVAGSYLGHLLSERGSFTDLRYWLYQKQVRLERRGPVYPKYTALVMLDDDDYWSEDFQARSKYKRDKLAAILDRMNAAGVNTVAFDIFMESPFPDKPDYEFPDYRAENEAFFQAMQRMCAAGRHVVLGTEYWPADHPNTISDVDEAPSIFAGRLPQVPCVSLGHLDFAEDMRMIPGLVTLANGKTIDSLSLAITRVTDPIAYNSLVQNEDKGFRFGQFLTVDDFATRNGRQFIFSGGDLQRMSLTQLHEALADKTVIVGGHYHPNAYKHGYRYVDMWNSPAGSEPGVMLHANFVEAMRDPTSTFTPISDRTAEIFEWSLAVILALVGALEVHVGWKWAGFVLSFLASLVLTYALQNIGIFLDFFIPIVIILLHTMTEAVLEMRHELHHVKHQLHLHSKKVTEDHS